ncbi:MAG: hypothetical protein AAF824_11580 [Bacteroidota bacterium]
MERLEIIERYIEGKMDVGEQAAFETEMRQSTELNRDVDIYRKLMRGIRLAGAAPILAQIEEWEKEEKGEVGVIKPLFSDKASSTVDLPSGNKRIFRTVAIAASIILFCAIVFLLRPSTPSYEKLYLINIELPQSSFSTMMSSGDLDTLLGKVFNEVNKGEYELALVQLEDILKDYPNLDSALIARGYIYLRTDQTAKAISDFKKVIEQDGIVKPRAEWYLALSFLKDQNGEQATKVLEEIARNNGHEYNTPAKEILKAF